MGCQGSDVVAVQVSRGRSLSECLRFLEKVKEENKTVQHILPNIQDKNYREMDKGMDSLKLTVSIR